MKKCLILSFLLFSFLILHAQQFDGVYKNENDSINFIGDKISFRITGFAGLSTVQVGEGNYEIIGDFMLVNTTDYPGPKTTHSAQAALSQDTCCVRVMDLNNFPVQGILIEYKNSSDKIIGAKVTGTDGRIIITEYDKINKLTASAMGYNPITFDFNSNNDYIITIAENDIIENKTAAFKFNKIDDETFSLILLSDNLNNNKDLEKELAKLIKRARKTNLIEKRFTKELPVFTR